MIARIVLDTGLPPELFADDEWGPVLMAELERRGRERHAADLLGRLRNR